MKKNISINIGGIIFHIEEDGYEKLKKYLDSVNKYFNAFEDSKEIIGDIESRIAEIFLSKLDEGKQIITAEDVDELIATMGTTKDFEASIEVEAEPEKESIEEKAKESSDKEKDPKTNFDRPKRLYRDTQRKVIGGVAAGVANYFSIDPIWVRLILLALLFNIIFWGLSGFTLLAYIVLWIAIPANDQLEDDKAIKKLFRDSDDKVLGGVAGGIASYFGTDPVVIRVIFVISIFLGGAGILAYIILWIITPEAKSITEKMQMQGEPVTISNIEENVRKSLKVKEGEESVLAKVLLFPFRLIAMVFKALSQGLGPILKFAVEALRVGFGVLLVFLGFVLMISFTITLAVLLGIGGAMESWVHFGDLPVAELFNSVSTIAIVCSYVASMVPALAILLLGLVIILKRKVTSALVAWTLFGLWLLSMIGLAIAVPTIIRDFSVEATHKEERTFELTSGTTELLLNELDWDAYNSVDLKLRGHQDSVYLLELAFDARGASRSDAKKNGEAVDYVVTRDGNQFYFDSEITFNNTPFRFQDVSVVFYIPYGQPFTMDYDLRKILRNTLWMHGYDAGDMEENEWVFDEDGLTCVTCTKRKDSGGDNWKIEGQSDSADAQTYAFEDFDEVRFVSLFDFEIVQGSGYTVRLEGEKDELDDVYLSQNGDLLEIRYGKNRDWWTNRKKRDKIRVFIEMPTLEYLSANGACEGDVRNFKTKDIAFDVSGASKIWADIETAYMEIDITGASEMTLTGEAEYLEVDLTGASELSAFEFIARDADVEVAGASKAKIYAMDELDANASGASRIRYRGSARVTSESNGMSSIKKD